VPPTTSLLLPATWIPPKALSAAPAKSVMTVPSPSNPSSSSPVSRWRSSQKSLPDEPTITVLPSLCRMAACTPADAAGAITYAPSGFPWPS